MTMQHTRQRPERLQLDASKSTRKYSLLATSDPKVMIPGLSDHASAMRDISQAGDSSSFQACESTSPCETDEDRDSSVMVYQTRSPSLTFEKPLSSISFDINGSQDQHLLRHFIRVVSRTLSIVHEDAVNPFITLIVPLAGASQVVMESLLALSASHLKKIYPEILQRGLSHQSKGTV